VAWLGRAGTHPHPQEPDMDRTTDLRSIAGALRAIAAGLREMERAIGHTQPRAWRDGALDVARECDAEAAAMSA
jgi:hypothetical protein